MGGMVIKSFAVEAVDGEQRILLDAVYDVAEQKLLETVQELQKRFAGAQILVNGCDFRNAAVIAPKPSTEIQTIKAAPATPPMPSDTRTAELAHHMLWESYARASAIQAHGMERMHQQQAAMTQTFIEQMQALRDQHAAAMAQVNASEWEKRVFEQETAYRHMAAYHRSLAEDERRAQARAEDDTGSLAKQIIKGTLGVIQAVGELSVETRRPGGGSYGSSN